MFELFGERISDILACYFTFVLRILFLTIINLCYQIFCFDVCQDSTIPVSEIDF